MAKHGSRKLVRGAAIATAAIIGSFFVSSASAGVDLRVESRPIGNPIEAYVTVTDAAGNPVGGLTAGSFTLTLDGNPITIQPSDFSLPPSANPDKNVSVVFAMDYSSSTSDPATRAAMEGAVVEFVNAMNVGDYAAIVKFNSTAGASIFQQFTRIDGAAGTDALVNAAMLPHTGTGSNLYDGINVALDHFLSPSAGATLPAGPRAVVAISDGLDNSSINTLGFVIDKASSLGIPLFSIAVGSPGTTGSNVMNVLAARTGGSFISAPTQAEITSAYATIASRLAHAYLLSFASSITDCNPHTLSVTVAGQGTAEARFTRCDATTGPVTVPNVVNLTQTAATTAITGAGLTVGTVTQQSNATVPAGSVSSQNPASGVGVTAGSAVNLVVSTGPAPAPGPVAVPNVVNLTQTAATTAITGAGLVLGTVSQESSTTVPAGSVISQNPSSGTSVSLGSAVALVVSTGPVAVPSVVGLTQPAATTAITGVGLAVGTVSQQSSATVPSGSVISQNPAAGTNVAAGSAVALVVSTGPAPVAVPNVVNLTQAAATTVITGAGLAVGAVSQESSATVASGSVIRQNPAAGTNVAAGSAVALVVSTGPAPTPPPTVSLSASPASIAAGATTTLTWSSINANTCTASGGWTGTRATSGSSTTGALSTTTSFTLTCTGPGGTASNTATVTVTVTPPPAASPTVSLAASPTSVVAGETSTLTWSSTNATACAASGGWSGARATSGSEMTDTLSATVSFTLTCTGPGGTASNTVSVTVTAPPSATVSLSASPANILAGATSTLTWSSTNATACTASGGWSGARAISGSDTIGALSSTTSFTLTCTGPGGTGSQTVNVVVTPQQPPKKSGGGGAIDYALLTMLLGAGFRLVRRPKGRY